MSISEKITSIEQELKRIKANKGVGYKHEKIVSSIHSCALEDIKLEHVEEILYTLKLVKKINELKGNNKAHRKVLIEIMKTYARHLSLLEKSDNPNSIDQLKRFFDTFFNEEMLLDLYKGTKKLFQTSMEQQEINMLFSEIEKKYFHFQEEYKQHEKARSQMLYSDLVLDILEQREHESLFKLSEKGELKIRSFLPHSEFPPLLHEADNPELIGTNATMSFNISKKEKKSILDILNTHSIIKDFRHACNWAIELNNVEKLFYSQKEKAANLLNTKQPLPKECQLAGVHLLMTLLDVLGKLTGEKGELIIQNFEKIKLLVQKLKEINENLKGAEKKDQQEIKKLFNKHHKYIQKLNTEMYENIKQKKEIAKLNPIMNAFCHINYLLAHVLIGAHYHKADLLPEKAPEPYQKRIHERLQELPFRKGKKNKN